MPPATGVKAALRSPLLPIWAVIALLPVGRTSEIAVLVCIVWLGLRWRSVSRWSGDPGARLLGALFVCYALAALISAFDAAAPARTWQTVAALLRFLPLGVFIVLALRPHAAAGRLYIAVASLLALWVADAWLQTLAGYSLGGHPGSERISGVFGADNLKLGPVLMVLSPFPLWAAWRCYGRAALALAWLIMLGPVLLAGSRAAWLGYALVGLAFAWHVRRSHRRFLLSALMLLVLAGLAGALAFQLSARFDLRMDRTLLAFQGSSPALDTALAGRVHIWETAWRMGLAHPVNGVGVRGFRYAYPDFAGPGDSFIDPHSGQGAAHAHQLLLELFSETGLVGLALWLLGAFLALRCWSRASPDVRERAFPAGVALVVMVFPLNTHLAFYSAWWGLLFWWVLSVWCGVIVDQTSVASPGGEIADAA